MNQPALSVKDEPVRHFDPSKHIENIKTEGYTVIDDCLPKDFVSRLFEEFTKHMDDKVRRFGLAKAQPTDGRDLHNNNVKLDFRPEGGNHDLNRWNMHLPTHPHFINEQVVANPYVLPIIDHFLDEHGVAFIIASDTPYPGSGFQNLHQDFPRFGFTVNIPLVDFVEDNAPLEVWPGSHVRSSEPFHTRPVHLSAGDIKSIHEKVAPKRLLVRAGSIIIRDQRLVHRGTANTSSRPRPCLSIWYKRVDSPRILDLTIPVPHRAPCDYFGRQALHMRRIGKGCGPHVANRELLNLGNLFGRVVEEFSASDRDYRRVIPWSLWRTFSPRMKQLLRFASIERPAFETMSPSAPRSLLGTALFALIASGFMAASGYLRLSALLRQRRYEVRPIHSYVDEGPELSKVASPRRTSPTALAGPGRGGAGELLRSGRHEASPTRSGMGPPSKGDRLEDLWKEHASTTTRVPELATNEFE